MEVFIFIFALTIGIHKYLAEMEYCKLNLFLEKEKDQFAENELWNHLILPIIKYDEDNFPPVLLPIEYITDV